MNRSMVSVLLVVFTLVGTGVAQAPGLPPEDPNALPAYAEDVAAYMTDPEACPGDDSLPWGAAKSVTCQAEAPQTPAPDAFTAHISIIGSHPVDTGVLLIPEDEVVVRVTPYVDDGAGFAVDGGGQYALRFFYTDSAGQSQRVPAYGDNGNPMFLVDTPVDGSYVYTFPAALLPADPVGGFLVQAIKIEDGATATFSSLFAPKEALLDAGGATAAPIADIMDSHGAVGGQEGQAWTPLLVVGGSAPAAGDGFVGHIEVQGAHPAEQGLLLPYQPGGDVSVHVTPYAAGPDGYSVDGDNAYYLRMFYVDDSGTTQRVPPAGDDGNRDERFWASAPADDGRYTFTFPAGMLPPSPILAQGLNVQVHRTHDAGESVDATSHLFLPKEAALLAGGADAAPVLDAAEAGAFTPLFVVPGGDGFTARVQIRGAIVEEAAVLVPHGDLTFTGTPYIANEAGAFENPPDGDEYALRLYYTTPDAPGEIHMIPSSDDESNPIFIQPVQDGEVTFTVPAHMIPVDGGINGFKAELIRFDDDRDAIQWSNLFVPKDALLEAGADAAPAADLLDSNLAGPNGEDLTPFTPFFVVAASDGMFSRITPQNAAVEGANMVISPDSRGNYVFQVEAFQNGQPLSFNDWRVEFIGIDGAPVLYEKGSYGAGAASAANDGDSVHVIRVAAGELRLPEGPSNVVALRFYINGGAELASGYSEIANTLSDGDATAGELAEVALTPILLNPPSTPEPPATPEVPPSGGA